jgi:hypothetical protein
MMESVTKDGAVWGRPQRMHRPIHCPGSMTALAHEAWRKGGPPPGAKGEPLFAPEARARAYALGGISRGDCRASEGGPPGLERVSRTARIGTARCAGTMRPHGPRGRIFHVYHPGRGAALTRWTAELAAGAIFGAGFRNVPCGRTPDADSGIQRTPTVAFRDWFNAAWFLHLSPGG